MELRHYWDILRRSWPVVVGLPLLVALLTIGLGAFGPAQYGISLSMQVNQRQIADDQQAVELPDYNNYNSWAASEYIVDDLLQMVKTERFAQDIAATVRQQHNVDLDVSKIVRGMDAERKHRVIYLTIVADERDHAKWIADAAIANLQQKGLEYWGRADTAQLNVIPLDQPGGASRVPGTIGLALDVAVRTLLALLLAVGLAFLRHYLDQTVRRRNDVEALGFEIVGAIPAAKGARG